MIDYSWKRIMIIKGYCLMFKTSLFVFVLSAFSMYVFLEKAFPFFFFLRILDQLFQLYKVLLSPTSMPPV